MLETARRGDCPGNGYDARPGAVRIRNRPARRTGADRRRPQPRRSPRRSCAGSPRSMG
ncbi:hypothetical protein IOD13_17550 [Brevibacterium casei]|nr:hypothetical protein [Brevibacterium casei]